MGKSEISKHMQCVDCRVDVAGVDVRSKSLTPPMSSVPSLVDEEIRRN